ncbi:PucR family transcriptional regulator [Streptomyces sp. NPDC050418]|uniref:PucR family transcriptional regulator n=1 Tax=Streptomyces sp. NPDC050418 TaxID=3365612 RepID=UPI0037A66634
MTARAADPAEIDRLALARVRSVANEMPPQLDDFARSLEVLFSKRITELNGDPTLHELLSGSNLSNLETFTGVVRYGISTEELTAPAAAEEYARRLARQGIASTALVRAYRLGHQEVVRWFMNRIAHTEPDPRVSFAAGRLVTDIAFRYIDAVSEQVVAVYEAEREQWLSHRSTVRAAALRSLLDGDPVEMSVAEAALGHRLRQWHVGAVVWVAGPGAAGNGPYRFEELLGSVTSLAGASGTPLFVPQSRDTGWGWIPLGASAQAPDPDQVAELARRAGPGVRIALGSPAAGADGFRLTHTEALRACSVATSAAEQARVVTSFTDSGVRTAALLAGDPEATRRLVAQALGPLADDTVAAARLRETLRVFLAEHHSYVATARLIHLHKNTVKYRVDKAVEARGRPLDDERLELELALTACHWLGGTVLRSVPSESGGSAERLSAARVRTGSR